MPQLMPMNWIFSSLMLLIIMISVCVIYSKSIMLMKVNEEYFKMNKKLNLWCW